MISEQDIVYFDSSSPKDLLFELCEEATKDSMPGSQNLSLVDWESNPASLLYKIYIEKVYDEVNRGKYMGVLGEDGKIILAFGCMPWDKNPAICLMPTRLYLREAQRGYGKRESYTKRFQIPQTLMNYHCKRLGYKATLITHNQYNLFLREATYRDSRDAGYMIFDYYDDPVIINYTKQWVMYHLFDDSYLNEVVSSLDSNKA